MLNADSALPVLRPDLELHRGPASPDGSPSYVLYDPVSGQYSRLGWSEAEVFKRLRPGLTLGRLWRDLVRETSIRASLGELAALLEQGQKAQFFAHAGAARGDELAGLAQKRRMGPLQWLLSHYLYLRLPLVQPDRFLQTALPWVRPFAARPALALYALLGILGLILLLGRLDAYFGTFLYFFSWQGALAYSLTLIAVKLVHEGAHAFTARHFGVRVRSMGIAFIIFWPVPYTDVTDAWRLPSRRARALVSLAGILAELAIAGVALLGWCLAPPGVLRSICFMLSSLSLASTLMVNLNPAMRFDGYYVLSDWLNVDNLQMRAFAQTKWLLRRTFLGLTDTPPEEGFGGGRLGLVVAYTLYTWLYRLGLYTGIAFLVYARFVKVLGLFLFANALWSMLVRPLAGEAGALWQLRRRFWRNPRFLVTALLFLLLLLWLFLPLPRSLHIPALAEPMQRQILYAPFAGVLQPEGLVAASQPVLGRTVRKGQVLAVIASPRLATEEAVLAREMTILDLKLSLAAGSAEAGAETEVAQLLEERAKLQAEQAAVRELGARGTVRAAATGAVCAWDSRLRPGTVVADQAVLGEVAQPGAVSAVAFVEEEYLADLAVGDAVAFCPAGRVDALPGRVRAVFPSPRDVTDYVHLTSLVGGELPVLSNGAGRLILQQAFYRVEVDLMPDPGGVPPPHLDQTGHLRLQSRPRSRVAAALRYLWRVAVRESAF